MFYVSIIFQKNLQVYPYSGILINGRFHAYFVTLGGGELKKIRYLGGIRKKKEIFKFSPIPPPLINNERSLSTVIIGF